VFQAKGFPYHLADLFGDDDAAQAYADGSYATLRLRADMYHRFHAPYEGRIERVTYHSGDTWNVNPVALKRIERLYCRNERATLRLRLGEGGHVVTLVPVAAILVASLRLHCVARRLHLRYTGPQRIDCDAPVTKGQELGWFEHGSTIIVFAPRGFTLCPGIETGAVVRMGRRLMALPPGGSPTCVSPFCHAPVAACPDAGQ
jgi:phosphatidylserine decarboxylase